MQVTCLLVMCFLSSLDMEKLCNFEGVEERGWEEGYEKAYPLYIMLRVLHQRYCGDLVLNSLHSRK